jgi:peptidoglycan hydrolase CwlO-like protein
MKKTILSVLVCAAMSLTYGLNAVHAEETTGEKIEDKASEVKKDTKKSGRKFKKSVRDATGNHSATDDAKDSLNNAGDDISHGAKKIKNKVD